MGVVWGVVMLIGGVVVTGCGLPEAILEKLEPICNTKQWHCNEFS